MNLDRIFHPDITKLNTPDTKYDRYGRVYLVKKKGLWNLKNHKDCKKATPDNLFKSGDVLKLVGAASLLSKSKLDGDFFFDSYDSWDNTCYVSKTKTGSMTWHVSLKDIYTNLNMSKEDWFKMHGLGPEDLKDDLIYPTGD